MSTVFLYLACIAHRNVVLYFVIISPVIAFNLSQVSLWKLLERVKSHILYVTVLQASVVVFMVSCIFFITMQINAIRIFPAQSAISPFRVPVTAAEYLKSHPVAGNIFNSDRFGGYLLWEMYPDKKVYIDGRFILRSADFLNDYLSMLQNPELFGRIVDTYSISSVVVPCAIFYDCMGLIHWLYHSDEWDLVFTDGGSVVFIKKNLNHYGRLDFTNKDDLQKTAEYITNLWKQDAFIRKEALQYLEFLIQTVTKR
jgi:hypothetical protein